MWGASTCPAVHVSGAKSLQRGDGTSISRPQTRHNQYQSWVTLDWLRISSLVSRDVSLPEGLCKSTREASDLQWPIMSESHVAGPEADPCDGQDVYHPVLPVLTASPSKHQVQNASHYPPVAVLQLKSRGRTTRVCSPERQGGSSTWQGARCPRSPAAASPCLPLRHAAFKEGCFTASQSRSIQSQCIH